MGGIRPSLASSIRALLQTTVGLACALGVALGMINALLTYYLRVVSIIVTIATSSIYYATLIYLTGGAEIYNLPDWWTNRIIFFQTKTPSGDVARITLPMLIMVAVVLMTHLLMAPHPRRAPDLRLRRQPGSSQPHRH